MTDFLTSLAEKYIRLRKDINANVLELREKKSKLKDLQEECCKESNNLKRDEHHLASLRREYKQNYDEKLYKRIQSLRAPKMKLHRLGLEHQKLTFDNKMMFLQLEEWRTRMCKANETVELRVKELAKVDVLLSFNLNRIEELRKKCEKLTLRGMIQDDSLLKAEQRFQESSEKEEKTKALLRESRKQELKVLLGKNNSIEQCLDDVKNTFIQSLKKIRCSGS